MDSVVISNRIDVKHRIYHRPGCMYAKRINNKNREEMSREKALKCKYHECKYCAGLHGDIRAHKKAFSKWEQKHKISFTYDKHTDTLYVRTEISFWKIYLKKDIGKYLLYHLNTYRKGMDQMEAEHGEFHRQTDVKASEDLVRPIEYIIEHDKAKLTIKDDYRKLPQATKQQKKYYRAAERKAKNKAERRLAYLFATLEEQDPELVSYSLC